MGNEGRSSRRSMRRLRVWSRFTLALVAAVLVILANAVISYSFARWLPNFPKEYQSVILIVFSLGVIFATAVLWHRWRARAKEAIATSLRDGDLTLFEFIDDRLTYIIEEEGIDR